MFGEAFLKCYTGNSMSPRMVLYGDVVGSYVLKAHLIDVCASQITERSNEFHTTAFECKNM